MKYSSSSDHCTPECSKIRVSKWTLSPSHAGLLVIEIIFLSLHLVTPSNASLHLAHHSPLRRTDHQSLDQQLSHPLGHLLSHQFNHPHQPHPNTSSPISMTRSKRNLNNIFVDLESEQSIYHHPSPVYTKKEFGQSDYWASIKRKWQQSEQCPCQCVFDQLNRKVIKCDEQFANLTSIPSILDPNVEVFIFTGTSRQPKNITISRVFTKLAKLQEITITYSNLPFIGDATFWPAIQLAKLNLSFNQIAILNEKHFFNLSRLTTLDLSHNRINGLPSAIFSYMPNLISLNMSYNSLNFLSPRTFHNLNYLRHLDISNNPLAVINQEDLKGLKNVTHFIVRDCHLQNLQAAVYQEISQIEYLDLSGNRFEFIRPDEFRYLTKLKYLFLQRNQITIVNAYCFSGHHLLKLDLSHNKLAELNECAFCNASILSLVLANNQFKKVLPNQLSSLSTNLIELNLANNPKLNSKLVDNLVSQLQNLEILNLANTNLDDGFSAEKTFQHFAQKLKHLNLARNNFFNLTSKMFPVYGKLVTLNLSFNRLFRLSELSAKNLAKLIKENRNLTALYIHGNPFHCYTCHIWYLRDLLKLKPKAYFSLCNQNDEYCAKCTSPPELVGERVDTLDEIKIKFCHDPSIFQRLYTSEPRVGLILALIIICSILIIIILIVFKYRQKSAVYYTNEEKLFTIQQVAKATQFSPSLTSPTESSPAISRLNSNMNLSFGQEDPALNDPSVRQANQTLQQQLDKNFHNYDNQALLSRQNSMDNYAQPSTVTTNTTTSTTANSNASNLATYLTQPISEHLIQTPVSHIQSMPIYTQQFNLTNSPYSISVISAASHMPAVDLNTQTTYANTILNAQQPPEHTYSEVAVDPPATYYNPIRSASASDAGEPFKNRNSLIVISRSNSLAESEETNPKKIYI